MIGDAEPAALALQVFQPLIGADAAARAIANVLVGVLVGDLAQIVVFTKGADQALVNPSGFAT